MNWNFISGSIDAKLTSQGGLTWMSIAYCHIRFVKAFEAQGIDRASRQTLGRDTF